MIDFNGIEVNTVSGGRRRGLDRGIEDDDVDLNAQNLLRSSHVSCDVVCLSECLFSITSWQM